MSLPAGATPDVSSEEGSAHCVLPAEAGCRPTIAAAPAVPAAWFAAVGVDQ